MDLTPLIDIMFNLALFLLLTMSSNLNPSFDINLPQASATKISAEPNEVNVYLRANGEVFIDGETIPAERANEIEAKLKGVHDRLPEAILVLQSDEKGEFGRAVKILDVARKIGMKHLNIGVKPE